MISSERCQSTAMLDLLNPIKLNVVDSCQILWIRSNKISLVRNGGLNGTPKDPRGCAIYQTFVNTVIFLGGGWGYEF